MIVCKCLRLSVLLCALGGVSVGFAKAKEINIGWTAWSDAEVVTTLAKKILEDRLGYKVKLTMADIGIQYNGLAKGDLDVMLMAWLPLTHKDYWEKASNKVVNLGVLYTRARLGWVVPSYIPKIELNTISDLNKPAIGKKLRYKINGIDPGAGLMQVSEKALKKYDLKKYKLVSSSGAAMTASLKRAIKRKDWIVVTGWSPHWKFAKWDLRYLEDPKKVLGGLERVHVLARKGLYQDHPAVAEFLSRMYIPLPELEATMNEATETSCEKSIEKYIKTHAKRVNYWVTGNL